MISFVILNYKSFQDTLECIDSIKKQNTSKNISIIVVDNDTLGPKEIEILETYTEDVVLLNENVGFAKGNNAGCKYAIEKYKPDFLCVINSDTLIEQTNFVDTIYKLYEEYNFDMMGPKILPEETDSCNPFHAYESLEEVNERIEYTKKLIKIYENKLLRNMLRIYIEFKNIFRRKVKNTNGQKELTNVALHGCALIFSKRYYQKYDNVFYPNTFLFHEEEFLHLRSKKDKLITLYSPKLEIIHKEGTSVSKKFNGNKYDALIFRNKEILKSLNLLKQEMEVKK